MGLEMESGIKMLEDLRWLYYTIKPKQSIPPANPPKLTKKSGCAIIKDA